jgi:hypothetical protein
MRILSRYRRMLFCLAFAACASLFASEARASDLQIPPDATRAINLMYLGKPQEAVGLALKLEAERPEHPLGYLIQADVLWWNIYCRWSERK